MPISLTPNFITPDAHLQLCVAAAKAMSERETEGGRVSETVRQWDTETGRLSGAKSQIAF